MAVNPSLMSFYCAVYCLFVIFCGNRKHINVAELVFCCEKLIREVNHCFHLSRNAIVVDCRRPNYNFEIAHFFYNGIGVVDNAFFQHLAGETTFAKSDFFIVEIYNCDGVADSFAPFAKSIASQFELP